MSRNELGLTPRQAQVMFWVAEGYTNDYIALVLFISQKVTRQHVAAIYRAFWPHGLDKRILHPRVAATRRWLMWKSKSNPTRGG